MRFYTKQHAFYCGIDLHSRTMYLCVHDQKGTVVLHKDIKARPQDFLRAIAPYRADVVVGVECMFSWYWLADLCAEEKIPFVLGHALYMKAIHGGKAKNDRIDSLKIAALLRGGMFPLAYVYPAGMRSTRDLLRRRMHLSQLRSAMYTHIKISNHQLALDDFEAKISTKAGRTKVLERFNDPATRKSVEVDLALIETYDALIQDVELAVVRSAKEHDAHAFHLLKTVPGIGKILALVILYEVHDIGRFPTVQDFASYARLVKCQKESAGKSYGTQGAKIGNVHLKWAFSEAAVLFLRNNPQGQRLKARIEKKHNKAKALSILAHKLGRAAYHMLKQKRPFDMKRFYAN